MTSSKTVRNVALAVSALAATSLVTITPAQAGKYVKGHKVVKTKVFKNGHKVVGVKKIFKSGKAILKIRKKHGGFRKVFLKKH